MPWCDGCGRFWNPNSMPPEGTCRDCGAQIAAPRDPDDRPRAPWHFWVLVVLATVYVGWRILQLVGVLAL